MPTLFLLSKNTSATHKYVLKDLFKFVPSAVKESKCDSRKEIKELMSMHECDSLVYFECTKRRNTIWLVKSGGPSVECDIDVMFSIDRLKFLVNSYLNVGHVLLFQPEFENDSGLKILKNVLTTIFKREDEFAERAMSFSYEDGKVFFRNYKLDDEMQEIGPRMVFTIRKVFDGEFNGNTLYENMDLLKEEEEAKNSSIEKNSDRNGNAHVKGADADANNEMNRLESAESQNVNSNGKIAINENTGSETENTLSKNKQNGAVKSAAVPNEQFNAAESTSKSTVHNPSKPVGANKESSAIKKAGAKRGAASAGKDAVKTKTAKCTTQSKADISTPDQPKLSDTEPVLDKNANAPTKKRAAPIKKSTIKPKPATPRRVANKRVKSATPSESQESKIKDSANNVTDNAPAVVTSEPAPSNDTNTKVKKTRAVKSKDNDQREEKKDIEKNKNEKENKNVQQKQSNKKAVKRGSKK
ncbi:hypothetical protein VCUG_00272 [Vavraia culicis subsp. floridensis]|uniref:Brix domain-containing protein n=1 Tax=Vavraia culicis (isolate floridensis) TaxID=948595 RepID=L2GX21_VAVCU|nr:uncharacterized protein VCUG_00272 [Vavraia culicis subsp. floridensis]ELA48231.1 hypothetical protein VCUG_00272 [Vavraia culicis subsp. floridensis]